MDLVEVRLFGALTVRRPDGSLVEPTEWKTTRSRDLLRILAIHSGRSVATSLLTHALWPDSDEARARSSLRTAVAHVRRVIGDQSVVRTADGLSLVGAWVDLHAFGELAEQAHALLAGSTPRAGLALAREAAALSCAELCADEPYAEWAVAARTSAARAYQRLLAAAAETAMDRGWPHDAIELAEMAVARDPFAERCYRVLMQAHAQLGEPGAALQAFERCRTALTEELGADPAPVTQDLHRRLLRGETPPPPEPPLIGRRAALAELADHISTRLAARVRATVLISGPPGAGAGRLARELVGRMGVPVIEVTCQPDDRGTAGALAGRVAACFGAADRRGQHTEEWLATVLAARQPCVLVIHDLHLADEPSRRALGRAWTSSVEHGAIVATVTSGAAAVEWLPEQHEVRIGPLGHDEAARLITALVGGPPDRRLLDHVMEVSDGLPARVVRTTRQLLARGRLTVLGEVVGLADVARDLGVARAVDERLARVRALVAAPAQDLMDLLAVARTAVAFPGLADLLDEHPRGELYDAALQLEDLGILSRTGDAFGYRHAALALHGYEWLRPRRRDRLHIALAKSSFVPDADRADHWVATGRPSRAVALLVEAATRRMDLDDHEGARHLLLRAGDLLPLLPTGPQRDLELFETLGTVCSELGDVDEALEAWSRAMATAGRFPGAPDRPVRGTAAPQTGGERPGAHRRHRSRPRFAPAQSEHDPS